MVLTLPQRPTISAGDVDVVSIDYTDYLDSGELLTGTPTITEVTTSDLTLANKAVSTGALVINGSTVATGMAVQFSLQGQTAATTYTCLVTATTDATIARTKVLEVQFDVEA